MPTRSIIKFKSALVAGCGLLGTAAMAPAAITWSGPLSIDIPANLEGVYLDLDAGGTASSIPYPDDAGTNSYTIGYEQPASWDLNIFFGGIGIVYSDTFQPFVDDTVGARSQILNVAEDTVISDEAAARTLGVSSVSFGGSGRSNGSPGESHFDVPGVNANPLYAAFTPGQQGYIAFILNPTASPQFGWMSVTLTNDGSPGVIHQWALSDENTFMVGQVPEPGSLVLLLAGATVFFRRSRRPIN